MHFFKNIYFMFIIYNNESFNSQMNFMAMLHVNLIIFNCILFGDILGQ